MKITYDLDQKLRKAAGLRYASVASLLELKVQPKPKPAPKAPKSDDDTDSTE